MTAKTEISCASLATLTLLPALTHGCEALYGRHEEAEADSAPHCSRVVDQAQEAPNTVSELTHAAVVAALREPDNTGQTG
jgi:hypothetical protein